MSDIDIDDTKSRKARASVEKAPAAKGMARIMIHKTERDVRDVFCAVNGKTFLLKRGVPIDVPEEVVSALQDAVGTQYVKESDPVTKRETLVPQQVMSYPFQYV